MRRLWILLFLAAACVGASPVWAGPTYKNVHYGTNSAQVMDIYYPPTGPADTWIILIHGGAGITGTKSDLATIASDLEAMGYPVANVNYRLDGSSSDPYLSAVDDVKAAAKWLRTNVPKDGGTINHIVAFGTSSGSSLALFLGTSNNAQVVIDFYGPTDLTSQALLNDTFAGHYNGDLLTESLGASYDEDPDLYQEASPITYVTKQMHPTLIYHGLNDMTVPPDQSRELFAKLQKLDVTSEMHLISGKPHGFLTDPGTDPLPYLQAVDAFIKANLP